MLKRVKNQPDTVLLLLILALLGVGFLALSSASPALSEQIFGNTYGFLVHQLYVGVLGGLILAVIMYFLPFHIWRKLALPVMVLSLALLIAVLISPLGYSAGGAQRWLLVGSFSFQPSEMAKLGLVLYLAVWIANRARGVKNFSQGLVPFTIIMAVLGGILILQSDLSTFGVMLLSALMMYFAGGSSIKTFVILLGLASAAGTALVYFVPYRLSRILALLHYENDPLGVGYQISQALFALGSGGLLGLGLGKSIQNNILPEAMGDSIFAIWGEETGFIGSILLLLLFVLFVWRGLRIAKNLDDKFASLLAVGITSWIGIQAFIHIGSIIGIIPLTGLPLPFISYGGSMMVSVLGACGLLLQLSRYAKPK